MMRIEDQLQKNGLRISLTALAVWTLYNVYQGYQVYSALDPQTFYGLLTLNFYLVSFTSIVKLFSLGWCPFVLMLQFIMLLVYLSGYIRYVSNFFVVLVGVMMSWSVFIWGYVFNFYGSDSFHFTIILDSLVLFLLLLTIRIDQRLLILFLAIGLAVGIFVPDILLAFDHLMGWGLPVPGDYKWMFGLPYATGG